MSIRTRKNLNELADAINGEMRTEYAPKDAFEHKLAHEWAKFERFMDDERTEDEVKIALDPVRNAISVLNDELRTERLEAMKSMPYKDAFMDYLRTQTVVGYRIKTEDDAYALDSEAKVSLDAYDFLSAVCTADLDGIVDACCILADNIARFAISDAAAISKNSMHKTYIEMRKRKGWDTPKDKLSNTALAKQMTEVASMISCGVAPKMINADVTFVKTGVINAKDIADAPGKFVKRDERTVVRYVFRAMYTRFNGLAYDFQDTTRATKGALGMKNNKDMAESPEKKLEMPDAGEVHVTVPEKDAKKSK